MKVAIEIQLETYLYPAICTYKTRLLLFEVNKLRRKIKSNQIK